MNWLTRFLCWVGCHDWREMDGRCCECGYVDPMWRRTAEFCTGCGNWDVYGRKGERVCCTCGRHERVER